MPDFDSGGVRLHYTLAGPERGAPIALVHGFASDYELNWVGSRWEQTLTDAGFRIAGLDCRGHGRSDKPHDEAAYGRTAVGEDVVRLLDHLGWERASYLGYSMGGHVGLEVARTRGDRLHRMVLGGIGRNSFQGGAGGAERIARRLRGDATVDDPRATMFYQFATARPINDLEALACCIVGLTRFETDGVDAIATPIRIVTGGRDDMAQGADELAASLPGADHVTVDGRNHMNVLPARQFKEAALAFLTA
jgi:pimeloyl-ACP methyl ester carboxylesterase